MMHTIIELMDHRQEIINKLQQLTNSKFELGASIFANRHPTDLRSQEIPVDNESSNLNMISILQKLKYLGAINYVVKYSGQNQLASTQFIIEEIDLDKLKKITNHDLDNIEIENLLNYVESDHRTRMHGLEGTQNFYINFISTGVHARKTKSEATDFASILKQLQSPARFTLTLDSTIDSYEDPNELAIKDEYTEEESKNLNPKLKRFCNLFNVTPREIANDQNIFEFYSLFYEDVINIKRKEQTPIDLIKSVSVNQKGEIQYQTAKELDTHWVEVKSREEINENNNNEENKLTIFGINVNANTAKIDLTSDIAKTCVNLANFYFNKVASLPTYSRTKSFDETINNITKESIENNKLGYFIRASNSLPNAIVIAYLDDSLKPFLKTLEKIRSNQPLNKDDVLSMDVNVKQYRFSMDMFINPFTTINTLLYMSELKPDNENVVVNRYLNRNTRRPNISTSNFAHFKMEDNVQKVSDQEVANVQNSNRFK